MQYTFRPAIAMIELIFAIVVMGIVLLSAPTLIGVSTQSSTTATSQESIYEVSSMVNLILTRNWDENNHDSDAMLRVDNNANPFPGKVARTDTDATLGDLNATDTNATTDTYPADDMDDFNGNEVNISLAITGHDATVGTEDYIDVKAKMNTEVQYGKPIIGTGTAITLDNPFSSTLGGATNTNSANIKVITVTLSSDDFPDKNISLSTFACNIGAVTKLNSTNGVNR